MNQTEDDSRPPRSEVETGTRENERPQSTSGNERARPPSYEEKPRGVSFLSKVRSPRDLKPQFLYCWLQPVFVASRAKEDYMCMKAKKSTKNSEER